MHTAMHTSFRGPFRPPQFPLPMGIALESYTLINWAIPPARLKGLLPPLFQPVTTVVDGRPMAWFSIFVGRNVMRSVGPLPALPYQFPQLNYRTYVQHSGGHGLYFLRSVVGDPLAAFALRGTVGFPVDLRTFDYRNTLRGQVLERVEAVVGQGGTEVSTLIERTGHPPETPGFSRAEDAVAFLADVPEGAFSRGGGRYGVLISAHPPLHPEAGRLVRGRFNWPVDHGILTPEEVKRPASIFMQGVAEFPTFV
jgi:hypothetical protein